MTGGLAGVVEVEVLAPLWFVACLSSPSPEPSSLQRARPGGFINEGMLHTMYSTVIISAISVASCIVMISSFQFFAVGTR